MLSDLHIAKVSLLATLIGMAALYPVTVDAQTTPWHLASHAVSNDVAPAAINAWGVKPGSSPVVVAVIDSGVIQQHPALRGRVLPGYTMLSNANDPLGGRSADAEPAPSNQSCGGQLVSNSYRTHGTEVASLIAGNGAMDVWGVNPNAQIVPIRLMGPCPMTRRDMMDAIAWAAGLNVEGAPLNPNPARVINMSFAGGGQTCSPQLQALVNQLVDQGIFLVAAAGNNFRRKLQEPANCHGVISVGSLTADQAVARYSALDSRISLYAPGGGQRLRVAQPWAVNKLRVATEQVGTTGAARLVGDERGVGTSFAAPIVSGFIALVLSKKPQASPEEIFNSLDQFTKTVQRGVESCDACVVNQLFINVGRIGS